MADPKYVRLAERLTRGNVTDTRSHWSISGLDVKEFPEDALAADFVRAQLRRGNLEEAGRAEFQEIQEANDELASVVFEDEERDKAVKKARQEVDVLRTSAALSEKVAAARVQDGTDHYSADQKRRKGILKAQKALEDEGTTDALDGESVKAAAENGPPTPVIGDSPVVEQVGADRGDAGVVVASETDVVKSQAEADAKQARKK